MGPGQLGRHYPTSHAHVDQHAITFHPQYNGDSNQIALIGNDGGIYRTANARAAAGTGDRAACGGQGIQVAWTSLNRGYGVTQFYHGTPFPDGTRYLAGAQDNGTIYGTDEAGADGWRVVFGGDGGFSAVHPTQISTWLMEYQWANLGRTTNGGTTITRRERVSIRSWPARSGPTAITCSSSRSPTIPAAITSGWVATICTAAPLRADMAEVGSAMPDGGRISAIAVSSRRAGALLVGTDKGDIGRADSSGDTTSLLRVARPRGGWVTSLAFDPRDANVLYATYGNFGGAHVFRSIDGGATWHSIDGSGSTGIPDIPVHSIVVDPDDSQRLYIGTDIGVMVRSMAAGRGWRRKRALGTRSRCGCH